MAQKHSTEYIEKPMTTYGRTQSPSRRYRRLRHPTFPAAEWTAKNPLLQRGEIGAESDTKRVKIGDGTTYWNDLPYIRASAESIAWGDIEGDIAEQTDLQDALDAKQDVISDLDTIRSGAALGATAVQPGGLATVATTGDYDDLLNKPTIPAAQVNSDWDAVSGIAQILNKPSIPAAQVNSDWDASSGVAQILNKPTLGTMAAESASDYTPTSSLAAVATSGLYSDLTGTPNLATVATSGSYTDLSNKPTIPTVNDGTLTIQKNGTPIATFTANASAATTANISVPTDTNDLTNGAGYITGITSSDVTSALGYTPVDASSLAAVATSGDYDDLLNKPTIPTVNNATLTIMQDGVSKGTFTANASSDVTISLDSASTSIDAEIVGVLTVASNGDVSGLSNSNYMIFPGTIDMTSASTFEMVFAFTMSPYTTGGNIIGGEFIYEHQIKLGISSSSLLSLQVNSGTSYIQTTGTTTIAASTKYYAKVVYDGTDYTIYLSTDGTTWNAEATMTATYLPGVVSKPYQLGRRNSGGDGIQAMHMAECYINRDGILIWRGIDCPGLHQRASNRHEVIAFQAPTAVNNYTWYRKYADGWVEQGGIAYPASASSGQTTSITLPVEMSSANYTVLLGFGDGDVNNTSIFCFYHTRTASNFKINTNLTTTSTGIGWQVSGMTA